MLETPRATSSWIKGVQVPRHVSLRRRGVSQVEVMVWLVGRWLAKVEEDWSLIAIQFS
jgi:hypothetical protein